MSNETGMNVSAESITVSGLAFEYGANGEFEYYYHLDRAGILWQVWRRSCKSYPTGWYASVHQPVPGGVDAILNNLIHQNANVEGLPEDGDSDPSVLLCGLAGLISSGQLPKYESYQARVSAPILNDQNEESPVAVFYVECGQCRQCYALKVAQADYGRLLNRTEPVQEIVPYLAPPMRELLISRTCPQCWKRTFGAEGQSADTRGSTLDDVEVD